MKITVFVPGRYFRLEWSILRFW